MRAEHTWAYSNMFDHAFMLCVLVPINVCQRFFVISAFEEFHRWYSPPQPCICMIIPLMVTMSRGPATQTAFRLFCFLAIYWFISSNTHNSSRCFFPFEINSLAANEMTNSSSVVASWNDNVRLMNGHWPVWHVCWLPHSINNKQISQRMAAYDIGCLASWMPWTFSKLKRIRPKMSARMQRLLFNAWRCVFVIFSSAFSWNICR